MRAGQADLLAPSVAIGEAQCWIDDGAGLATDFCVVWTALDARKAGFETYVVEDACRCIDTQGSLRLAKAWRT
jgi:hypothetical protein